MWVLGLGDAEVAGLHSANGVSHHLTLWLTPLVGHISLLYFWVNSREIGLIGSLVLLIESTIIFILVYH